MSETQRPDDSAPIDRDVPTDQISTVGGDRPGSAAPGPILTEEHLGRPAPRKRRFALPITLFCLTCLSTFWVAIYDWTATFQGVPFRNLVLRHWDQGVTYMVCVVLILLMHELGHFVATVYYKIPASLPIFIPLPLPPLGTMGAVIAMDGRRADRREIFDIGLAGPIAGLVIAIPVMIIGVLRLELGQAGYGQIEFDLPLLVEWLIQVLRPEYAGIDVIQTSQVNAWFMAGWVGLLITGLNMMPVSQLDGGHVLYALLGRRAHVLARTFIFLAICLVVWDDEAFMWSTMVILVILLGVDHPPTANDYVQLGRFRTLLGYVSLVIPILCFPPHGFKITL